MIADDRGSQKVLRSSAIIWKHTSATVCDPSQKIEPCSILWNPKFCDLRSKCIPHYFEFRPMIQRFLATKPEYWFEATWLALKKVTLVTRNLRRKLRAMSAFTVRNSKDFKDENKKGNNRGEI